VPNAVALILTATMLLALASACGWLVYHAWSWAF
jgi:hypothetical protein